MQTTLLKHFYTTITTIILNLFNKWSLHKQWKSNFFKRNLFSKKSNNHLFILLK